MIDSERIRFAKMNLKQMTLSVVELTGPDPDTPPRFPGWSRLVESHCIISKECTKGPHLKEK